MDGPTVIIDLSPVVLLGEASDWRNVERVVKAWREQKDPDAVFYGIADNSLWYKLDDYGRRRLSDWKKRRCARSVPWADPEILELAEANPDATVITAEDLPQLAMTQSSRKTSRQATRILRLRVQLAPMPRNITRKKLSFKGNNVGNKRGLFRARPIFS